ncbi:MAG: hypothetical protein ACJAZB_001172 [Psychrosphaera sp.]|jgi:hypothetical protein
MLMLMMTSWLVHADGGSQDTADTILQSLLDQVVPVGNLAPIDYASWPQAKYKNEIAAGQVQGQVTIKANVQQSYLELIETSDSYNFELTTRPADFTVKRQVLPDMQFDFVTYKNKFIPAKQQLTISDHPHWDYILAVGDIWQVEPNQAIYHVTMPFNLVEKNQNCVHNGVLTFVIDNRQNKAVQSPFYYQISSETCLYYKVDMWGNGRVSIAKSKDTTGSLSQGLLTQYQQQQHDLLPTKTMASLTAPKPDKKGSKQLGFSQLSLPNLIKPEDMTSYGLTLNGQHYVSQCQTRAGVYPYCAELVLPSYSTAKTIFAGLSMVLLKQEYNELYQQKVSDWVPECNSAQWQDVTFLQLLNMTTGNYDSLYQTGDEGAEHSQIFFAAGQHNTKVKYACQQFKRKTTPGTKFVYHTSDTYLLGTALNHFIKDKKGQQTDVFDYVFANNLWKKLKLNPVAYSTLRTNDDIGQPFVGYGLFFTRDDVFKVSQYLATVSARLFNPQQAEQGALTSFATTRYDKSFWKQNIASHTNCNQDHWLPYLSGYGGISIVLVQANIQYFYFSDSGVYDWSQAITGLDSESPICSPNNMRHKEKP